MDLRRDDDPALRHLGPVADFYQHQPLGASTLNIGTIGGGRAPNVIPDQARAEIFIRLVGDSSSTKKAIRDACEGELQPAVMPNGKSRLWTHPTLAEYVYHRVKSGVK
jgi:acetylornithine deacetylase/succinyl-diaminopimelate desuccinylase-like protein